MHDIRWFAPNRYCALPLGRMRETGLRISESGDAPARLAFAADGQCAVEAFAYATRHAVPLHLYLWDLPPWRLGGGSPDLVFTTGQRLRRIPRLFGGYSERAGYYSRIRYVAQHADRVWCPSQQTTADVRRLFGVPAEQLPFCYDSDRFNASASTPRPITRPTTLLSISRLVPSKNHSALLRAAAEMRDDLTVQIIGRGPEAESLRREAATLRVNLELNDAWASDDEIVAAYRAASVVVCPSRFEGFGLTPMEGLAMQRPVVATAIPVHREFVGSKVLLFDPEDSAELARRCLEALAERPGDFSSDAPPLPELSIDACAARLVAAIAPWLA